MEKEGKAARDVVFGIIYLILSSIVCFIIIP